MPRICQECERELPPRKARTGSAPKFCCAACRQAFNNRRMTRGAMLYDLFMQARYSEGRKDSGNITTMAQVARVFREIDAIERNGRPSWSNPNTDDHADPYTEVVGQLHRARKRAVDTAQKLCA